MSEVAAPGSEISNHIFKEIIKLFIFNSEIPKKFTALTFKRI